MYFFFNDTATTEIYTLSLHDALPIFAVHGITPSMLEGQPTIERVLPRFAQFAEDTVLVGHNVAFDMRFLQLKDRKSTRLNSSHANISYAVFCLKKKKQFKISLFTSFP